MIQVFNVAYIIGKIKKENYKLVYLLYIFMYLIVIFLSPSSGSLLVTALLLMYLLIPSRKNKAALKQIILCTLILISLVLGYSFIISNVLEDNAFLQLKFTQIQSLNNLTETQIEDLPFSVRVRVAEMINIFYDNANIDFFFGKGMGGFFSDDKIPMVNLDETAFTQEEIDSNKYYKAHFFISNYFLKFGAIGLVLVFEYVLYSAKRLKNNYSEFLPILFVFLYSSFWGVKILFVWAFLFGSIMSMQKLKESDNTAV
jgi:hypothetical protein